MKLRNSTGYLNVLSEGTPPKKRSMRIVTILYLLLLLFLLGYMIKFAVGRFYYVTARGQVEITHHTIRCDENGVIKKHFVAVGDKILEGSPLVAIYPQNVSNYTQREMLKIQKELGLKQEQVAIVQEKIHNWKKQKVDNATLSDVQEHGIVLGQEILQVNYRISAKQSELQVLSNQLDRALQVWQDDQISWSLLLELKTRTDKDILAMQQEVTSLQDKIIAMEENLVALHDFRDKLFNDTLSDLKEQNNRLQNEIIFFKNYYGKLEKNKLIGLLDTFVHSDNAGTITMFFKKAGDYCAQGDSILTLQQQDPIVKINGFFAIKTLASLQPGKMVTIIFPDKTKSQGKIEKVYSTALQVPQLIKKKYMPITVDIKTEIFPHNPQEKALWKLYNQMDVILRVRK